MSPLRFPTSAPSRTCRFSTRRLPRFPTSAHSHPYHPHGRLLACLWLHKFPLLTSGHHRRPCSPSHRIPLHLANGGGSYLFSSEIGAEGAESKDDSIKLSSLSHAAAATSGYAANSPHAAIAPHRDAGRDRASAACSASGGPQSRGGELQHEEEEEGPSARHLLSRRRVDCSSTTTPVVLPLCAELQFLRPYCVGGCPAMRCRSNAGSGAQARPHSNRSHRCGRLALPLADCSPRQHSWPVLTCPTPRWPAVSGERAEEERFR